MSEMQQVLNQLILGSYLSRVSAAFSRGALTSSLRDLDATEPASWEFAAFSQNGEDGIIDYLLGKLKFTNRYFVEIGAGEGVENNTSYLALGKRFSGVMIEGNQTRATICAYIMTTPFVSTRHMFVNKSTMDELESLILYKNPDVLSLDIDGVDYYVAQSLLARGFRPKIVVVEYNSAFGPERPITVRYQDNFNYLDAHPSTLYSGVGLAAWRSLLGGYGYKFITVEQNGVNAFFVDPNVFDSDFLEPIRGVDFKENAYQLRKFGCTWEGQFELVKDMSFFDVTTD